MHFALHAEDQSADRDGSEQQEDWESGLGPTELNASLRTQQVKKENLNAQNKKSELDQIVPKSQWDSK